MKIKGTGRISLVGLLACVGCSGLIKDPTQVTAGGTITINMSNSQGANLGVTSYEAKTVAGNLAPSNLSPQGWSIITGTPNALDNENQKCRGIGIGFAGKPTAGETIPLVSLVEPDGGAVSSDLTGHGTLAYNEGCPQDGQLAKWVSTGGSLIIDSVGPSPDNSSPSTAQVKFHFSGVSMIASPDTSSSTAQGSFTADGSGQVDVFAGLQ